MILVAHRPRLTILTDDPRLEMQWSNYDNEDQVSAQSHDTSHWKRVLCDTSIFFSIAFRLCSIQAFVSDLLQSHKYSI